MHRGDAGVASMYSTPNDLQFDVVERFQVCLLFFKFTFLLFIQNKKRCIYVVFS